DPCSNGCGFMYSRALSSLPAKAYEGRAGLILRRCGSAAAWLSAPLPRRAGRSRAKLPVWPGDLTVIADISNNPELLGVSHAKRRAAILWCLRRDSNPHTLANSRFSVCRVYRSATEALPEKSERRSIPSGWAASTRDRYF